MDLFYESDALHFLFVSPEEGSMLLQTIWIIHDASPSIAAPAHPATKRSSLVAVIKVEG